MAIPLLSDSCQMKEDYLDSQTLHSFPPMIQKISKLWHLCKIKLHWSKRSGYMFVPLLIIYGNILLSCFYSLNFPTSRCDHLQQDWTVGAIPYGRKPNGSLFSWSILIQLLIIEALCKDACGLHWPTHRFTLS
jgi:hypothetical protein